MKTKPLTIALASNPNSGKTTDADHTAAAEIVVAYCKGHKEVAMMWRFDGSERTVAVTWQDRSAFAEMRA